MSWSTSRSTSESASAPEPAASAASSCSRNWYEMFYFQERAVERVNALFMAGALSKVDADMIVIKITQSPMATMRPKMAGNQPQTSAKQTSPGSRQ